MPLNMTFWLHLSCPSFSAQNFDLKKKKNTSTTHEFAQTSACLRQNSWVGIVKHSTVSQVFNNLLSNSLIVHSIWTGTNRIDVSNFIIACSHHFPCLQNINIPMTKRRNMDKWLGFYMSSTSWWSHLIPLLHKHCLWSVSVQ